MALNIKRKCQDSKDLGAVNADDEAVESPLHDDRASDNFNLNGPAYASARDYPVPDNVPNIPADVYELWKAIVFIAIEKSFSLAWERLQTLNRPSITAYIERHLFPWKDQ